MSVGFLREKSIELCQYICSIMIVLFIVQLVMSLDNWNLSQDTILLNDSFLTKEEQEEISSNGEVLDLITAIDLIQQVEKSPYKWDRAFLKKLLGVSTFMKMWKLGYINAWYISIDDNLVNHPSYTITQRYVNTKNSIKQQRKNAIFELVKYKLQTLFQN